MRDEMSFHANVRNWLEQPFRSRTPLDAMLIATLMVLWQGANVAGFAYEYLARSGYRPSGDARS